VVGDGDHNRSSRGARRSVWLAEDAARELPNLPLEDALQLVHVHAGRGSPMYEKAARLWLVRHLTRGHRLNLRSVMRPCAVEGTIAGDAAGSSIFERGSGVVACKLGCQVNMRRRRAVAVDSKLADVAGQLEPGLADVLPVRSAEAGLRPHLSALGVPFSEHER